MQRLFVTLLLCVFSFAANAAIFQVRGTVTESGVPVPGLLVSVQHVGGSTKSTTTDGAGFYRVIFNEAILDPDKGDPISVIVTESGVQIGTGDGVYKSGGLLLLNVSATTLPPTISLFTSADGRTVLNADSVSLVGTTSEPNRDLTVMRSDELFKITTDGSGAFQLTASLLQNVVNEFTATVADEFGKTARSSFSVVEDSTAPVITILGANPETIEVFSPYIDAGATALDSVAGNLTASITTSSNVNVDVVGAYAVNFSVADSSGNTATATRAVNVVDTTPPDAPLLTTTSTTLNANSILVQGTAEANSAITITGGLATATGTATGGVFSVPVNLSQDTTNTLSVTATDASNNLSSSSVIVIVEDSTPPIITGVTDSAITNQNVTLSFNEGTGVLNGAAFASGSVVSAEGTHSLVVTDDAGNASSVSFTIDKTPPIITWPTNGQNILSETILVFGGGDGFLDGGPVNSRTFVSATGSHTLRVRDTAGNEVTVSFTIRTPNPPTISGLSVSVSGTSLVLSWTGSADSFQIDRDGNFVTVVYSPGYTDSSATPGKTHSYRVVAHRDGLEAPAEATGLLLADVPVSNVQVETGAVKPGDAVSISALGAPGVSGKVLLVNQNGNVVLEQTLSETTAGVYSGALSIPNNLPDGAYDVIVDVGGQKSSVSGGVSIDSTAPLIPQPLVTETPAVAGEPYTIRVAAEPGSVVTADVSGLNPSAGTVTLSESTPGNFETRVDLAPQAGSKSVPITVTDQAGNTAQSTLQVVVETPDTPVSDVVLGGTSEASVEVRPGGTLPISVKGEPGESAKAELVDAVSQVVVSSITLKETASGQFVGDVAVPEGTGDATLDLRISVGNRVATTPGAVVVDGTPPAPAKVSAALSDLDSGDGFLEVVIENPDATSVSVDASGLNPALTDPVMLDRDLSVPGRFRALISVGHSLSGERSIVVVAEDKAGNISTSTQIVSLKTSALTYTVNLPTGHIILFHLPLNVAGVKRVSDLLSLLGDVTTSLALGLVHGRFVAYVGGMGLNSAANFPVDGGVILNIRGNTNSAATPVVLRGIAPDPALRLRLGLNLIGATRRDPRVQTSRDFLRLLGSDAILIFEEGGEFFLNTWSEDGQVSGPSIEVTGGRGFIALVKSELTVVFQGQPWQDVVAGAPTPSSRRVDNSMELSTRGSGIRQDVFFQLLNDFNSGKKSFEELENSLVKETGEPQGKPALLPQETRLLPNYPNPFNPETWIPFQLSEDADVTLTVYDLKGNIVRILDIRFLPAGSYTSRAKAAHWDGKNAQGERMASGVYIYELHAGSRSYRARMALLR